MRLRFINLKFKIYYFLTALLTKRYKIEPDEQLNQYGKIIVSLTTKPERIGKTWLVVESILRQKRKPDALILYLAKNEFHVEERLPRSISSLRKRGLKIVFVEENLKPHNKYFHAIYAYPKADILTVDDDKIYPDHLISSLVERQRLFPEAICAVMTRRIEIRDRVVNSYLNWEISRKNTLPSHALLGLGVCGVLYPSGSLHPDVFDIECIRKKALLTDDLWIKIMALKNNTKVVSAAAFFDKPFVSIVGLGKDQLMSRNVLQGGNDLVFKDLLESYNIDVHQLLDG